MYGLDTADDVDDLSESDYSPTVDERQLVDNVANISLDDSYDISDSQRSSNAGQCSVWHYFLYQKFWYNLKSLLPW